MNAFVMPEPYKLSAGALALLVHGIFFSLLYFSFSWQMKPPQGMVVDIWDSLPAEYEVQAVPAQPEKAEQIVADVWPANRPNKELIIRSYKLYSKEQRLELDAAAAAVKRPIRC